MNETYLILVTVDYSRTLAEMVAAGKYDWISEDMVEQNFSIRRPTERPVSIVEIVLVHINKQVGLKKVLRHLDRRGLRPATIEELLAIGEHFPNLQRQFPIVGLGSSWIGPDGRRCVPCLRQGFGNHKAKRHLRLHWCSYTWGRGYRFAAVRK